MHKYLYQRSLAAKQGIFSGGVYTPINSVFIDCWISCVNALGVTSKKKRALPDTFSACHVVNIDEHLCQNGRTLLGCSHFKQDKIIQSWLWLETSVPPPPPVLTQSECKIRTLWILFDSASRSLSWLSVCTSQAKGQWGSSSNIYSFHHSFISRFEMMKWNKRQWGVGVAGEWFYRDKPADRMDQDFNVQLMLLSDVYQ